jgi:hypothetical protein
MVAAYIQKLHNYSIEYATERPLGSPFVSVGRAIRILKPADDLAPLAKLPHEFVPALIGSLGTADKDWAANLVLYALTGRDAMVLTGFENDIDGWRRTQKESDQHYWDSWWKDNRDHLLWNGEYLSVKATISR